MIYARITTKDRDRGQKRIYREIKMFNDFVLKIGIQGDRPQKDSAAVVVYATKNEFGDGVPERSFIRSTVDEQIDNWQRLAFDLLRQLISSRQNAETVLQLVGERMQVDVQKKIVNLRKPSNSLKTIALKGSSNPLIDTGRMRQSIRYSVERKKS